MRSRFGVRAACSVLAGVAAFSTLVAGAQTLVARVAPTATTRAVIAATPSPNPTPTSPAGASRVPLRRALPPLPPVPKTSGHIRHVLSVTGACIEISGNGCAGTTLPNVDENFVAGQNLTWQAKKLPGTTYKDFVLAPGSTTPVALETTAFNAPTGPTETQNGLVNGVYVFASLNTVANTWDAITYVLVGAPVSIDTFSDGTLSVPTETFTTNASGTTNVFMSASGLTPQHNYALGVEDQLTGKCVFTAPVSSQTTPPSTLCNLGTTGVTGTNPTGGGVLTSDWGVTLATAPALPQGGTYMATVFDQTAGQRVASRQFVVIDGRASASTGRMNLEFNNNNVNSSTTASTTRVAWNGTAATVDDSNQTGMRVLVGATGLPSLPNDNFSVVVTDPTGNLAGSTTVQGSANIVPNSLQFTLPTQTIPFEMAYPGSTWVASVYDTTSKTLMAEQAFQVLGYSASVLFTNPVASSITIPTPADSVTTGITFTNTANLVFGPNNGDPISQIVSTTGGNNFKSVTLTSPSTGVVCTPATGTNCTGTYSDTNGNAWTATLSCGTACGTPAYTLTLIPVSTTTPLLPGASVTVTGLTFAATGCNTCKMTTSITPTDMITGTGGSNGTNGIVANPIVFTTGNQGVTTTGSVSLVGYYDASNTFHANQDVYTPRFDQAIVSNNQPFTAAASKVVFAYTLKNTSTGTINIFDLALPSSLNSTTPTVDTNSPNKASVTENGFCDGLNRPTLCVTPTTNIAANSSQTFWFDVTPPAASFSYTDVVGTVIQAQADGFGATPISIPPASTSVQTFVGTPTTVDSVSLGAYSLNGSLMLGALTPGSIGTSTTNTLSYTFRNTQSGADPFPDYVDLVELQIPNQTFVTVPTSCSSITVATSGWSCLSVTSGSGQPTTYTFGECPQQITPVPTLPASSTSLGSDKLTVCPFSLPNEPSSLAPSGTLTASIPVTSGAAQTPAGSPITISTWAHGATTDAWSTPITSTLAVTPSVAAGVGFADITAAGGTGFTPVSQGVEPQIVGNYITGSPNSNNYLYKIQNTGSPTITSITIGIPGEDTTGTNGADPSGNIWKVNSVTLTNETTNNANGCTAVITNPANGTSNTGNITITCTGTGSGVLSGQTLDVQFNALAPLKVNSAYNFPATINGSTTAAAPNWFADTEVLIALSANLTVAVNGAATCPSGVVLSPATSTVNFGTVAANTTVSCPDAMVVTVSTDASSPSNWSLFVSTSGNPARTAATGSTSELNIETDATNSTSANSITCPTSVTPPCFAYDNSTAFVALGLTSSGTGTRLAFTENGGTGVNTAAVKIFVSYEVSIGTETVPATGESETITYTFIAN